MINYALMPLQKLMNNARNISVIQRFLWGKWPPKSHVEPMHKKALSETAREGGGGGVVVKMQGASCYKAIQRNRDYGANRQSFFESHVKFGIRVRGIQSSFKLSMAVTRPKIAAEV